MQLWFAFKKARIGFFSIIAVTDLAWAILLSVFASMKWKMFMEAQRWFLIAVIVMSGVTSILLYLMMVSAFIYKWEVVRVVSMVGLHVGESIQRATVDLVADAERLAAAVLISTWSADFPCSTTGGGCMTVHMISVIGAWITAVLLTVYSFSLPVVPYIPRPETTNDSEDSKHSRHISKMSTDSSKTLIDEEKMIGERMYVDVEGVSATLQVSTGASLGHMPSFKSEASMYSAETGETTPSMKSPSPAEEVPPPTALSGRSGTPSSGTRVQFAIPPRPTVGLPGSPMPSERMGRSTPQPSANDSVRLQNVPPRSTSIHTSRPTRYDESQMPLPPVPIRTQSPAMDRDPFRHPQAMPPNGMPAAFPPALPGSSMGGNMAGIGARPPVGSVIPRPPRGIPIRSATVDTSQPYQVRRVQYAPPRQFANYGPGGADIRRFRSAPNEDIRRVPRNIPSPTRSTLDPAAWQRLVMDAANGSRL
ncbi:hypothetical protein OE88DRAFT_1732265 [Heliocybe sulcata]|uniref:Uncharacterized protein n=1 Tax=Heliocybe sulcata TaxID=5364 RepID=A0A5C3NCG3_9AGAM|nr:hypothetical protein OE88DRAFT_1732265 [Heliocybe sulcata]